MAIFYAQPYDIAALGFYFEDAETYLAKINAITNEYGEQVEEFELQFIDGNDQKFKVVMAVGECGYQFDYDNGNPDDFDLEIYLDISM